MKLIRVGQPGKEKPGVLREDGTRVDVSAFGEAVSYTHLTLPTNREV